MSAEHEKSIYINKGNCHRHKNHLHILSNIRDYYAFLFFVNSTGKLITITKKYSSPAHMYA
jgi:hypothetical protein